MAFKKGFLKTSVARKNLMALTGLFIAFFLIIHLAGNLILLLPDSFFPVEFWGGVSSRHDMYNAYSHFLVYVWPITLVAWVLYLSLLVHALDALLITLNNSKAAGEKYAVTDRSTSKWYSRNMGILGSLIGLFILLHMSQFWLPYKVLGTEHDLYELVSISFKTWWWVIIYEIGIIALGFHLLHGIESAHRSLGFFSERALKYIKLIAVVFALILTLLYAVIPVVMYLR